MLSFELYLKIDKTIREIEELKELFEKLEVINTFYEDMIPILINIGGSGDGSQLNNQVSKLHGHFIGVKNIIVSINLRLLFKEIEKLNTFFEFEFSDYPREGGFVLSQIEKIDKFSVCLSEYLGSRRGDAAVKLLKSGSELYLSLKYFIGFMAFFKKVVEPSFIPEKEEIESITISWEGEQDYDSVCSKLSSIGAIYAELCELLKISKKEYPLQIIKIETGSLLAILAGAKIPVQLITSLIGSISIIKTATGFWKRNFTREGKLENVMHDSEKIQQMLNFEKLMSDSGIDTTEMKDNIAKCGVIVSRNLLQLIQNDKRIIVNGVEYLIDEFTALRKQLPSGKNLGQLDGRNQKQLTNGGSSQQE